MIVGVDLGTRRAVLACIDEGFLWSASLETTKSRRLFPTEVDAGTALGLAARRALSDAWLLPKRSFFERPVVFKNVNTAVGQALSAGAFFSQLPGQNEQIYPSAVWKKEVVGHGSASKDDVRVWVEREYPALAEACAGIEDRYDAVAICEYGRRVAQSR